MKKIFSAIVLSASLFAAQIIELKTPFSAANKSIIEVWAYGCGHCKAHFKAHTLEKLAKASNLRMDEELSGIMGKYAKFLQSAFLYAKYLDLRANNEHENSVYKALKSEIFAAEIDDIRGYERIIKRLLHKNAAEIKDMQYEPWYAHLAVNLPSIDEVARVHGTPGYVINGKYLINLSEVSSEDEMLKLVQELSNK